jgi:plasmid stabilization system protein ParE
MMSRRYVLAPEAALDLVQIWRYIKKNVRLEMADRVVYVIREKIVYLAGSYLRIAYKPWLASPSLGFGSGGGGRCWSRHLLSNRNS